MVVRIRPGPPDYAESSGAKPDRLDPRVGGSLTVEQRRLSSRRKRIVTPPLSRRTTEKTRVPPRSRVRFAADKAQKAQQTSVSPTRWVNTARDSEGAAQKWRKARPEFLLTDEGKPPLFAIGFQPDPRGLAWPERRPPIYGPGVGRNPAWQVTTPACIKRTPSPPDHTLSSSARGHPREKNNNLAEKKTHTCQLPLT